MAKAFNPMFHDYVVANIRRAYAESKWSFPMLSHTDEEIWIVHQDSMTCDELHLEDGTVLIGDDIALCILNSEAMERFNESVAVQEFIGADLTMLA